MVYTTDATQETLDAVFAALAHPARRELVTYLASRPTPPRMADLAVERGLSPQLLNKHTAALEKAGIAYRTGTGAARYLVLDPGVFDAAQRWITQTRAFWQSRFETLDAYITTLKENPNA